MLNKDIEKASRIISSPNPNDLLFSKYSKLYSTTNERIDIYSSFFDNKGKDVLTVTSSGDHALYAILGGASIVDTFDVNRLSKYYLYLKLKAVEMLSFEDYKVFVNPKCNFHKTNFALYSIVREGFSDTPLDNDVKTFWDSIYNYRNYASLFRNGENINQKYGLYEKDSFMQLKESIPNVNVTFTCSDILSLPLKLQKRSYNSIWFSNISDYLCMSEREYNLFISRVISPYLLPSGQIACSYNDDARYLNKKKNENFSSSVFCTKYGYESIKIYKKS